MRAQHRFVLDYAAGIMILGALGPALAFHAIDASPRGVFIAAFPIALLALVAATLGFAAWRLSSVLGPPLAGLLTGFSFAVAAAVMFQSFDAANFAGGFVDAVGIALTAGSLGLLWSIWSCVRFAPRFLARQNQLQPSA